MISVCTTLLIGNVYAGSWSIETSPTGSSLRSVFMVSANDGWAVGVGGVILRWDGVNWNTVSSPTTEHLYSVFMVSPTDGWAVGGFSGGVIIRWNGVSWNIFPLTLTYTLNSVFMVNANDGWASGVTGQIFRWDGSNWNAVTSPTNHQLYSLYMVSSSDGWAVGGDNTIIRWNGANWNIVPSPPNMGFLMSVFMVSATDGWAVGRDETLIRWNGVSWNTVSSPTTSQLISVYMVSSTDGWIVCEDGTMLRWDGANWNTLPNPTTSNLYSLYMVSANNGWAVGQLGTIIQWKLGDPVASFNSSPVSPNVGETLSFDATSSSDPDGTIVHYAWDFGDGNTGTGMITAHSYSSDGTYTVTLTVTDNDGLTDTITLKTDVVPPIDTTPPGGLVVINGDVAETNLESVTLTLEATDPESGVTSMRFSNDGSTWTNWEVFSTTKAWTLSSGAGTKKVFVQFQNGASPPLQSITYSDTITLKTGLANSSISVSMSVTTLAVSETMKVSGSLFPAKEGENIRIQCRIGEGSWNALTTVTTDSLGKYSYSWTPTAPGTYEIKINWEGDENTISAEKISQPITVNHAISDAFPLWVVIPIIVVIVVVIVVYYYLRKRKSKLKLSNLDKISEPPKQTEEKWRERALKKMPDLGAKCDDTIALLNNFIQEPDLKTDRMAWNSLSEFITIAEQIEDDYAELIQTRNTIARLRTERNRLNKAGLFEDASKKQGAIQDNYYDLIRIIRKIREKLPKL